MTDRKTNRPDAKELISTGALLAELDEQIKLDNLNARIEDLFDLVKGFEQKFDKLDAKFENNINKSFEELDEKICELSKRVEDLSKNLSILEERVKNISDLQKNSWVNTFITIAENKNARMLLIFFLGWTMSTVTSSSWARLLDLIKIFGG